MLLNKPKIFHLRYCLLLATGLFILPLPAGAQKNKPSFTLSGKVTDPEGRPLAAASIYITDLRKGAISDSAGNYVIEKIPKGNFLVSVDYVGYHSEIRQIDFRSNVHEDFRMELAVTEQKEIVITSSLQASSMRRNPIPIINISNTFLSRSLNANVVSAIASVPGVSAVTTGPNVAKPFIRGLGFNRILTMFDGVRQEGQQWGDEHGIEIDENMVDRVEVIKGPASLLYGSDALAGVINFIPPSEPLEGDSRGSASMMYHTNNNLLGATADAASRKGDWSWGLTGSYKMAADYQNKIDGRVYNTGFRQSSVFFQSALHKKWGYSRIGASYYHDLQEIPEGTRDSASRRFMKDLGNEVFKIVPDRELSSYKLSDVHQRIRHFRLYNISNFTLGRGRMESKVGFQKNIRQEFEDPNSDEADLFLDLNTLTYGVKYFLPQLKNINFITGANGMYQSNNSMKGNEFIIPDYHQVDVGPFVYGRYAKGKSEWAAGVRWDVRHLSNEELYVKEIRGEEVPVFGADTIGANKLFSSINRTFSGLSGSLGFSHRFNRQWNFKINVARGFRAPTVSEIASNGIHAGAKIYQLGNESFRPEFSFQQDINLLYRSEHLTVDVSAFNNSIRNYIFNKKLLAESGADSVVVPGYETFQYTVSHARLYGGEITIDLHPHPLDWLHFENSVSMVFARNEGRSGQRISAEEKYLPFIPPVHGRSELRGDFSKWKNFKKLYVKIQLDVFARQNRVFSMDGTESPTPGYQLLNAGLGADVTGKDGKTRFSLSVMADNLLNTAYQSHMSRLKYFEDFPDDPRGHSGIYEQGRSIRFRLTFPFF